jgi:hypothetical protein
MERPWMDTLMDALQPPPSKKPAAEEPALQEPEFGDTASERPSMSAPMSDSFASVPRHPWTQPTKSPLEYEGSTYWNQSWSDRILGHAPAIMVVVLFAAALGALSFFYRVQVGDSLIRLGEKVSGEPIQVSAASPPRTKVSTVPSASPPPMQYGSTQPVASSDSSVPKADTAQGAPANLPINSKASPKTNSNDRAAASDSRDEFGPRPTEEISPQTSADIDNGRADFQIANTFLHQARTPDAKARAAALLWAAVAKGSSDAEIELADIYGRGDGVRRNCQQARILLAAARDKHNLLAGKETDELRVYGCR